MPPATFLEVARDLLVDPEAKAAFQADPDGYLASRGFDGLTAEDVADATGFVADTLPPDVAVAVAPPEDDPDADLLGRFAGLDPMSPDELDGTTTMAAAGGEDVEVTTAAPDTGAASLEDAAQRQVAVDVPDPGFGVGWENDDLDDVSAPVVHDGELPVGFEMPIEEAGLVEDDPTHDLVHEPEPAHDAHDDLGPEHHDPAGGHDPAHDPGHDGHLDVDLDG